MRSPGRIFLKSVAFCGATVMTRISFFLERANFTIVENPITTRWVLFVVIVGLLVIWRSRWASSVPSNE